MRESNKKTFEDVGKRKKRGENNKPLGFGRRVRATNNFNFFVQYLTTVAQSRGSREGGIPPTKRPRRQAEKTGREGRTREAETTFRG